MQHNTIWVKSWAEAERAADTLDQYMDQYGIGENAFRVAIIPGIQCPYDTGYLTDRGAEEIKREFQVS